MIQEIGRIKAIYRYPVKSMAGQQLGLAELGWHGFKGDRRFAFLRVGVQSGFPWLTATKFPELIQYAPVRRVNDDSTDAPTHVRTPEGRELELQGEALQKEISDAYGSQVEMIQFNQGIFDEGRVSIISRATIAAIEEEAGIRLDVARFRPNILIEPLDGKPFEEDEWLGKIISFGEGPEAAAVNVYMRDERCMMINLDPTSGAQNASVLKAVVRMNDNYAGVYATVMKAGRVSVEDKVYLQAI
jgi:uncharacterized protein YcbX